MSKKPIIGVIPDYVKDSTQSYSTRPHYCVRKNYLDMLTDAGALVVVIPYDYDSIDEYIGLIDGLMITGGFFDICPTRYSKEEKHPETLLNTVRENFEFEFVEKFLQTKLPFFGICNGMQVINCLYGGKIIQHIPDEDGDYMIHEQSKVKGKEDSAIAYHDVLIEKDSLLHKIVGESHMVTNSSHHQAIRQVGPGMKINSRAKDGIIEGIEDPNHPFCIGVQWHPEFNVSKGDKKIFEAFINKTIEMKNEQK